ncbi:MAG: SDR family NAD(P)-dependent oxidoreductase [Planctomycetaceae bacterium]|nr:SDR family NAD(P)-dependent oxidoreductase [Planctomycetaceae bacterium]
MGVEPRAESLTPLQNAVYLLKQAQAKLAQRDYAQTEPIAVIGIGCRFPGGGQSPEAFWRELCNGVNAIEEVPAARWNVDDYYDPDPSAPGKMNTRWGGFLDKVDEFDAEFFGISPREAVRVDPQHRLLLEVAWEALEDAGLPPSQIAQSKTGVFVGVIGSDYALLQSRDLSDMDVFSGTGSSHAILANRLSYFLNVNGPSVALDTACSSSLVTVHLACQSLRRGESDMALAGGINLILSPEMTLALTKAHMMAPDGRCKAFDATANGYVRGEGCGMIVLKRLSDATAAGDRILALVRGTAVNHDGRSNGLSAPNGPAQEAVIRTALADAGLSPTDISYIEAHGTGTKLGDPIEIEALREALCAGRSADRPLMVGSVKTNIGHLESAAGVAGLVKVAMMLRHGQVPPHLHLQQINPLLRIDGAPLEIPTAMCDWPRWDGVPHCAGISAFGFGGTNGHVILSEAPSQETPKPSEVERPRHLMTLSARTSHALVEQAVRYAACFEAEPSTSPADAAFTANVGRDHFPYRAAIATATIDELRDRLQAFAADPEKSNIHAGQSQVDRLPRIGFLFTGQGAQYAGMGRLLYETQPTFRAAMDACDAALRSELDRPLLSLLNDPDATLLNQTGYTQPAMFAIEYALAALWRRWGIEPTAVMGHSVGEFAAACTAGVFSLEDGIRLIARRAKLMQSLPAGGVMAAVMAAEPIVAAALEAYQGQVAIAALNGPASVVISGDEPAVRQLLEQFDGQGIRSKTLATSHAFHSHRMDPILGQLDEAARSVQYSAPKLGIVSNLTGRLADAQTYADPTYWSRHARSPVRFAESLQAMVDAGCEMFLEIGPSPTLIGMGRRCVTGEQLTWLPSLRPGRDDWQVLLDSLAELYVHGATIDWAGFDRDYVRRKISLPSYPFQRRRYWASGADVGDFDSFSSSRRKGPPLHPLLGRKLVAAASDQVFEASLAANRPAILFDHKIQQQVVMPASGYLEMVLAASAVVHDRPWRVSGATLLEPLLLDKTAKTVQVVLSPEGPSAASFRIVSVSQPKDDSEPVFTALAVGRIESPRGVEPETIDLSACRARFTGPSRDEQWQKDALNRAGLDPGPSFCWIHQHWVTETEGLAELRPANEKDHLGDYQIHPGLLDCGFQLLGAVLPGAGEGIDAYVPMGVDRIQLFDRIESPAWYLVHLRSFNGKVAIGDIRLLDASGRVLAKLEGVRLRRVPRDWLARRLAGPLPDWCYELTWTPQSLPAPEADQTVELGRWLIFDERERLGAVVADQLQSQNQRCTVVPFDATPETRAESVRQFLADPEPGRRGIAYLSNVDINGQASGPNFAAARDHGWGGVLDVVRVMAESNAAEPPRLWLVTRAAQAVAGDRQSPIHLAQSPVWGLGRVIAAELPALACTRVDLDGEGAGVSAAQLADELLRGQGEDQIVYHAGVRRVARLRRLRHGEVGALEIPNGQPYRLDITSRGQLDNVVLRAVPRRQPGPGQVEIRVRATGLNFRDVLNVLDLYPGEPGAMGGECAGEVAAVGPGVEGFKPGDSVIALAPATFASYTLTMAEFVAPKPTHLSFDEAATLPICFVTAELALRQLGRLQPGERVLIHAASGGVGLAAIQIARQIGAEIFATAGSPGKREYLKSLGIAHVFDSRSAAFADEIRQATGGQGVDMVLNSLTGEAIAAGLSVLREGGRFMELGKTDLWDQARVDQFKLGLKFHAIALDHMMAERPKQVGELIRAVVPQFVDKKLVPLPLRTYRIQRIVDALRHMARAEHIGKVVIQAAAGGDFADRGLSLHDDGTYLVTGGLGGLGLKLAGWLVDRGARHLVLLGRSGASDEAKQKIEELEKSGVEVSVRRCDAGNRQQLSELLDDVARTMPPLRGVFHLAGVLDDGTLREQTRERFDRVMAAKMLSAWNLHELTLGLPLDLFVLFSSAAALMGSPGQGNYAAANAFLDALAHYRRWEKRHALSVNWGSWAEVGMAAKLVESEGRRWAAAGLGSIEPVAGMHTLEQLIVDDRTQAGVLPIDWPKFFERIPAGAEPAWLSDMARDAREAVSPGDARPVLLEELQKVTPAERLELALTHIRKQAARVLAIDESNLPDPRRTLNELGFDSLTGVEFANRVGRSVGHHLNPALLFDYPTLETFAGHVVRDVLQMDCGEEASAAKPEPAPEAQQAAQNAAEVEGMSEQEMEALVAKQLEELQK